MSTFEDLAPCTYFERWKDVLLAVGWLGAGYDYPRGDVSPELFGALVRSLENPWQPVALAGRSQCPFCKFSRGPARLTYGGTTVELGANNLFVPSDNKVLVAPSLIAHYIDAHEYLPPRVFQDAVIGLPEMRSIAYLKEMRARGIGVVR